MEKTKCVFDLETDGLLYSVTQIWCTGVKHVDDPEYEDIEIYGEHEALLHLLQSDVLIGHNIIGFDLPVIKKLYGYAPKQGSQVIDTLILSRMLCKERRSHSLESWGETLGFPKGSHEDWSRYSKEMAEYCKRDVELTAKIYEHLMEKMR